MDTKKKEKKFMLDEHFIRLFPDIAIGVLAVGGIRKGEEISEEEKEKIRLFLANANEEAKKFLTSQVISENKNPLPLWRAAYKKIPRSRKGRALVPFEAPF